MIQSLSGLMSLIFVAWLFSEDKKNVSIRNILTGLALQLVVATLMLKGSCFQ